MRAARNQGGDGSKSMKLAALMGGCEENYAVAYGVVEFS